MRDKEESLVPSRPVASAFCPLIEQTFSSVSKASSPGGIGHTGVQVQRLGWWGAVSGSDFGWEGLARTD